MKEACASHWALAVRSLVTALALAFPCCVGAQAAGPKCDVTSGLSIACLAGRVIRVFAIEDTANRPPVELPPVPGISQIVAFSASVNWNNSGTPRGALAVLEDGTYHFVSGFEGDPLIWRLGAWNLLGGTTSTSATPLRHPPRLEVVRDPDGHGRTARIRIARPSAVSLEVMDLQGRRVSVLLDDVRVDDGATVPIPSTLFNRPGLYYLGLSVGGQRVAKQPVEIR